MFPMNGMEMVMLEKGPYWVGRRLVSLWFEGASMRNHHRISSFNLLYIS